MRDITTALANCGHSLTVISFDSPGSKDFYEFDERVKRIRLDIRPNRRTGLLDLIFRTFELRRVISLIKPEVAVGFMHSAYVPLSLALSNTRIPVIASEHIVYQHYSGRPIERALIRLCATQIHCFTAISEEMRLGFPRWVREKMEVITNPVPLPPTECVKVHHNTGKVLLTVGRLEPQKDHKTLIHAFAQIASTYTDWTLRIVGAGPLQDELQRLIDRLKLSDRALLVAATPNVISEYKSAELFVMSSLYESFGLATAEALSHGLPVVGFRSCPGTNELIRHGRTGLLVEGQDRVNALAQGLAFLMSSPELRIRMSNEAPLTLGAFAPDVVASRWALVLATAKQEFHSTF